MLKKQLNNLLFLVCSVVKSIYVRLLNFDFPKTKLKIVDYFLFISLIIALPITADAAKDKLLPRFASIKSNQVNARTGPGITYPIEWVFITKGEPIKITAEFEQWRKIEDVTNVGGWVHSSVLSPKRFAIITGKEIRKLYKSANKDSRIVAKLEPQLRCQLDKCSNKWCKIKCRGYKGWIESSYIWGITQFEQNDL